ncbi:alpha/beta hydrolase [Rhodococcus rhodnii]|uniref:Epoxide hydrolase n=2 Tax=Rhodococcus rhodnii TaxID=38312 RepID=R7WQV7_9NOCA|nr:alpha/beta hydrolase [Rhodococcus rhodnii]EOM77703.1 epoxide hydrolase [Rhodococcus rhodnii LMG 5362]TXG89339.1 alpha/beta hydrolase [Rhodococcus rhodnii]
MTRHLGHARYLVRGTDYGLAVALHLGATFPRHVAGVHIGGIHLAAPADADLPADLTDDERAFVAASRRWHDTEGAYDELHATKPETLAYALSDSPVGLLAWIVEKYRAWCATPDRLFDTFSPDDLLSIATVYWATGTVASSLRLYREDRLGGTWPRSVAPVAVSQPAHEEYTVPESWWRRLQPVSRHRTVPGAAHFPEWEAPTLLAADLAEFARTLR